MSRSHLTIRAAIIILTISTALVHLSLLFPDLIFILNGLGYLTLLAALYLPVPLLTPYKQWIRFAFIGYTALTVIIWLFIGERSSIGYLNKASELLLIGLLWFEGSLPKR